MSDTQFNCVLGICCLERQQGARVLGRVMVEKGIAKDLAEALPYCEFMMNNFDLAPYLSLANLKAEIAKYARGADYVEGV
jgi:hypothetical protein